MVVDSAKSVGRLYSFGEFRLDADRQLLFKDNRPFSIPPRFLHALCILVSNCGKDLEKSYLMDQLWPDTVVEENNLTVIISALRKVLGESPSQHKYIATLPGRGYRFVADVAELKESSPTVASSSEGQDGGPRGEATFSDLVRGLALKVWRALVRTWIVTATAALVTILFWVGLSMKLGVAEANAPRTIAVLPFKVLGQQNDDEYLGLGMADGLTTRLAAIRRVVVRPIGSVIKYGNANYDPQGVGHELNVSSVLSGTVEKNGEEVRFNAQLLRVDDGAIVWSDEFAGKFDDIFAIQDRIAEQTGRALTVKLNAGEKQGLTKQGTGNPEAYQLYLRGRYFWNRRDSASLRKAIDYFQQAAEKDPQFPLAYSGQADCYNLLNYYDATAPRDQFSEAEAATRRALALDNELADAYASLAWEREMYDWDFAGSDVAFRHAIQLRPNYSTAHQWYATFLASEGNEDEALAEIGVAQNLDPTSLITNAVAGSIELYARRPEQAIRTLNTTLKMDPRFVTAHWFLVEAYESTGRGKEAIKQLDELKAISGDSERIEAELAYAYALCGEKEKAKSYIRKTSQGTSPARIDPYQIALIYLAVGDRNRSFQWLSRAYRDRSLGLIKLKADPRLAELHADPRFAALLTQIGLPTSESIAR